ncbi:MAG: glutamyl-tRNA reductase [Anaerolineae bacterium]|nr:glutamyl-tRNA reductase [Anaerolineae bacterium]MDW8098187.1 glutamyl-tRNA reductase [Anaerolineae bacterium]
MRILLVGMNHTTAPIHVRERVALSGEALHAALESLQALLQMPGQARHSCLARGEGAILSTCNRLEIYAAVGDDDTGIIGRIERFLADLGGFPPTALSAHLYRHEAEGAVRHLLRVAAGLDSMVLGEPQILGQVADAYQAALAIGTIGPILSALFRQAIHAGKRARTETAIGRHPTSVSNAAVALALQVLGDLKGRRVLLVGAGEMAEAAAHSLAAAGASEFRVISRTYARADELARSFGGSAIAWEQIGEALSWADIVLTSATAPHTLIHAEGVRQIMAGRGERPLFFIDIAVPRNVDPTVEQIPHVYLYDIDDLRSITDESLAERRREVPKVEAIVIEEAEEYLAWLRMQRVVPTLKELRSKAEAIAREELQKTLSRLPHLSESERRIIVAMTHSIVQKILHEPTVRLKEYASNGRDEYGEALRELFGLSGRR